AAAMGHAVGRLQQDQALRWIFKIDSPSVLRFYDGFVVQVGLVSEQRKFETSLPADGTMTVRVSAAGFREYRHDILHETQLGLLGGRGGKSGAQQKQSSPTGHCESSSSCPTFSPIGGDTASPLRSRNDFAATGPDAVILSSTCVEPGSSTL